MGGDLGVSRGGFTMEPFYEKTWENRSFKNGALCHQDINIGNNVPEL